MSKSTPPTLLFAGRVFAEAWGGVRELAEGLLRALAPLAEKQGRVIEVLVPRAGISPVRTEHVREVVLPQFASSRLLWDHWTVPRYVNLRGDCIFYNNKLILPLLLRKPGIVSIYDFMYFPQPERYGWREYLLGDTLYMRWMIHSTIRRARKVHLISRHSMEDARRLFPGVPESRYSVIYPGVDAGFWGGAVPTEEDERMADWMMRSGIGDEFVVYAGGLSRRKNVAMLVRAFLKLREERAGLQLVITGGAKPTIREPDLDGLFAHAPDGAIIRVGLITREQLRGLYRRAMFSVFPSLYEGFGFPPVESQTAGCPVISSNASSLPEVVGESAPTFDPRSQQELLERMKEMLDPEACHQWAKAGRENAARFGWERTAKEFMSLVEEVEAE